MTPAERAVTAFGSKQALADAAGVSTSRVHRWLYAREEGGTGGLIPTDRQRIILEKAKERGLSLTADDLIGSPVAAKYLPKRRKRAA